MRYERRDTATQHPYTVEIHKCGTHAETAAPFLDQNAPKTIKSFSYDARNTIVHAGRLGISAGEEGQATWYLASWLLRPVLTWFAEHPAAELADLDAEIASPPPTASNRAAVAPPPP